MTIVELNGKSFVELIKEQNKFLFVFDYDGTLTPAVEHHADAIFSEENKERLNKLCKLNEQNPNIDIQIAIVTGRTLKSLKSMLGKGLDEKILLIGTHGAEIGKESDERKYSKYLEEIKSCFINESHIIFEEKTLALTIHYKNHPNKEELKTRLLNKWDKYKDIFRVQEGHGVFEYLPKEINKGIAIDFLKEKYPDHFPMYFGDDLTDNFAFIKVNDYEGLSIQVQDKLKEQEAKYQILEVENTYELIHEFMKYFQ